MSHIKRWFNPQRDRRSEVMDQPGLDAGLHRQALAALRRINLLSRTAASLWPDLVRLANEHPGRPLDVLDVACGGGDVTLRLASWAAAAGLPIRLTGCDISPVAVDYAREQARKRGLASTSFLVHDAVRQPLPGVYDAVLCSLFLHHLDEADAGALLRNMATAARSLVLLSDLRRTRIGFLMAKLAGNLLTRSPVVRVDGPLSVAAALSVDEVRGLAVRSGLTGASVRTIWPQRFLLRWRKP